MRPLRLHPPGRGRGATGRLAAVRCILILGNVNAVPADLTSMMIRRLFWLIVLSFFSAFTLTAVMGPVATLVAYVGLLIVIHAEARGLWSTFFVFIVTAAAGPVAAVVACAGVLIYALVEAREDAARRTEVAEAEAAEAKAAEAKAAAAAAEAVIAEAEAVIAAAQLRLLGGAGS